MFRRIRVVSLDHKQTIVFSAIQQKTVHLVLVNCFNLEMSPYAHLQCSWHLGLGQEIIQWNV